MAARVVILTFPVDFIDYGYRIFAMVDNLLSQRGVVRLLSYMTPDERERYALAEKVEIDESRRRQEALRLDPQTLAWLPFEDRMAWVKTETESIGRLVAAGETRMEILMDVIDRELPRRAPVTDFEI
jgi:hypothetical protein